MLSAAWVREMALAWGFSACGIARSRPLDECRADYAEWLEAGLHDGLGYLERNVEKRFDPGALVADAKTVIVCAVSYNNDAWRVSCADEIAAVDGTLFHDAADGTFPRDAAGAGGICPEMDVAGSGGAAGAAGTNGADVRASVLRPAGIHDAAGSGGKAAASFPKIASFALARDYHETIKEMLGGLLRGIRERYPGVRGRCFTDSAPLLEKAWAVEAGLGWIGKNSLLISPEFGSFVLLGELVVDTGADHYDEPYTREGCGMCRRCMDACPNGAITAPRRIDLRRCISHLSIERPAVACTDRCKLAAAGTTGLYGWIFGCDICQSVCPHNRCAPRYTDPAFTPLFDPASISAEQWLTDDSGELLRLLDRTPIGRRGLASIRAQLSACR